MVAEGGLLFRVCLLWVLQFGSSVCVFRALTSLALGANLKGSGIMVAESGLLHHFLAMGFAFWIFGLRVQCI